MRTSTRNAAKAIANFENVTTNGALSAENVDGLTEQNAGRLAGKDYQEFMEDRFNIDYVVKSYNTPIAWRVRGRVYKVKQKFSVTTSRHQGQLYLLEEAKK